MNFKPRYMFEMQKRCICREAVNCNTIIISAKKMFRRIFRVCKFNQLNIFGMSGDLGHKCYMYTNNYNIMLDTIFRMTYLSGVHIEKLKKKFGAKEVIIIDDLNKVVRVVDNGRGEGGKGDTNGDVDSNIEDEVDDNNDNDDEDDETENKPPPKRRWISWKERQQMWKQQQSKGKAQFEVVSDPKIVSKYICPRKWKMFDYMYRGFYDDKFIYRHMIWKLKSLRRFLDEDELEDYDCWEAMLAKMFPELYDFCLRDYHYKLHNYYIKKRLVSNFVYLISLTQMQLSQYELFVCWKYVLRNIRKSGMEGVSVYECENGMFDYNIAHAFTKQRTLFITDKFIVMENLFFFTYKRVYYPYISHESVFHYNYIENYPKDVPNKNAKLIKRTKFKKEFGSLLDLFDLCEKECNGKIIDINSAYTFNIFSNMKKLYAENKFEELMPEKFEETEYSWVLKESYADVVNEWVNSFNKISKIKVFN